jgi:hypothetical protein
MVVLAIKIEYETVPEPDGCRLFGDATGPSSSSFIGVNA